jgi:muconolactone delta-isomerase
MEYLVTMTTHVPEGTSEAAVDDVKAREAAHSRELATEGRLLRLWRPPLQPGEWRTLGMFDAADRTELETVLRSMPLRVWRTDDIVALRPQPNDPGRKAARPQSPAPKDGSSEFFTTFTATVLPDTPSQLVDEANAREATRVRELAGLGLLERLWQLPGSGRTLGLWRALDSAEMQTILGSLPLRDWFSVETLELSVHPSDPPLMDA